jgi:F-type H+-transporting ATPase subunit alpha
LFYRGIRPALNVGLSVSRVGSAAQTKAMKKVAGKLRLELAQFRELEAFAQFATDLDEGTRKQIERGRRLTELLKQPQYHPLPFEEQVAVLFAAINGYLDQVAVEDIVDWEHSFLNYLRSSGAQALEQLHNEKAITETIESDLKNLIEEFNKTFKK